MNSVSALVVAAGRGQRLHGPVPKQFLELEGKPILYYTLRRFEDCAQVDRVLIVAPEDWLLFVAQEILDRYGLRKVDKVIPGGKERQDSVFAGLKALEGDPEIVVIHDGVRPFVSAGLIGKVIEAARQTGAAIVAARPKDTIKRGDGRQAVETYRRDTLWAAQTPQAFRYGLILRAHQAAARDKFYSTDDAALVERLGHPVAVVEGDEGNLKITTEADLIWAEALIRKGKGP